MLRDPVTDLPREVEPFAIVLEDVDNAQALLVVIETARHQSVDDALAGVAERRVPQVVAECNGFRQFFMKAENLRDGSGNLRYLERMCEARPIVVAGRREEHLCLVLEASECLAVDDPVAIALKCRTNVVLGLGAETAL